MGSQRLIGSLPSAVTGWVDTERDGGPDVVEDLGLVVRGSGQEETTGLWPSAEGGSEVELVVVASAVSAADGSAAESSDPPHALSVMRANTAISHA